MPELEQYHKKIKDFKDYLEESENIVLTEWTDDDMDCACLDVHPTPKKTGSSIYLQIYVHEHGIQVNQWKTNSKWSKQMQRVYDVIPVFFKGYKIRGL